MKNLATILKNLSAMTLIGGLAALVYIVYFSDSAKKAHLDGTITIFLPYAKEQQLCLKNHGKYCPPKEPMESSKDMFSSRNIYFDKSAIPHEQLELIPKDSYPYVHDGDYQIIMIETSYVFVHHVWLLKPGPEVKKLR